MNFKNKKIGIFGLGKAGKSSIEFLLAREAEVYAWDDDQKARNQVSGVIMEEPEKWPWKEIERLVLSPGIPLEFPEPHRVVLLANSANCKIICDIDLLYYAAPKAKYVGVTGTNGKSTTTALIHHVAKHAGLDVQVGGNIGISASSLPILSKDGVYILEISSYQIELMKDVYFDITVLLNITPDHIDRHGDLDGYINAKKKIFNRQTANGKAIIAVDDEITRAIYDELKTKIQVIPVSGAKIPEDVNNLQRLPGRHNAQNIAAAYAALRELGIAHNIIIEGIKSFPGLAHRLQYIGEKNGMKFINDSKATNAIATEQALNSFDNIYWIVGGIEKEGGIKGLEKYFPKVKHAFLIGKSQDDFAKTLDGKVPFTKCDTLENAFNQAVNQCSDSRGLNISNKKHSSVILLSPACASFDQFKNFEHRGEVFCKLVESVLKL